MSGVKGKSGRKKLPLALLKKRGSRLDRRNEEVATIGDVFIAPKEMSDGMKAFYDTYLPILQKLGMISVTDSPAFERMARNYARIRALDKLLGNEDSTRNLLVYEVTRTGKTEKPSAAAKLLKDYEILFFSQLREFGLTPSSRGSITKIETTQEETEKLT